MNQMTLRSYKHKNTTKSKYRAIPTTIDGIRFHSKKEADFYRRLKVSKEHADIKYFLLQVPFRLPGNIRYLCDFMIVNLDNSLEYVDVKGRDTPLSLLKRKQVAEIYGIEIQIV
jgi:hypothetical protein